MHRYFQKIRYFCRSVFFKKSGFFKIQKTKIPPPIANEGINSVSVATKYNPIALAAMKALELMESLKGEVESLQDRIESLQEDNRQLLRDLDSCRNSSGFDFLHYKTLKEERASIDEDNMHLLHALDREIKLRRKLQQLVKSVCRMVQWSKVDRRVSKYDFEIVRLQRWWRSKLFRIRRRRRNCPGLVCIVCDAHAKYPAAKNIAAPTFSIVDLSIYPQPPLSRPALNAEAAEFVPQTHVDEEIVLEHIVEEPDQTREEIVLEAIVEEPEVEDQPREEIVLEAVVEETDQMREEIVLCVMEEIAAKVEERALRLDEDRPDTEVDVEEVSEAAVVLEAVVCEAVVCETVVPEKSAKKRRKKSKAKGDVPISPKQILQDFEKFGVNVLDKALSFQVARIACEKPFKTTKNKHHDEFLAHLTSPACDDKEALLREFYQAQWFAAEQRGNEMHAADKFDEIRNRISMFEQLPTNPIVTDYLRHVLQSNAPLDLYQFFLKMYSKSKRALKDYVDIFNYAVRVNPDYVPVLHDVVPSISREFQHYFDTLPELNAEEKSSSVETSKQRPKKKPVAEPEPSVPSFLEVDISRMSTANMTKMLSRICDELKKECWSDERLRQLATLASKLFIKLRQDVAVKVAVQAGLLPLITILFETTASEEMRQFYLGILVETFLPRADVVANVFFWLGVAKKPVSAAEFVDSISRLGDLLYKVPRQKQPEIRVRLFADIEAMIEVYGNIGSTAVDWGRLYDFATYHGHYKLELLQKIVDMSRDKICGASIVDGLLARIKKLAECAELVPDVREIGNAMLIIVARMEQDKDRFMVRLLKIIQRMGKEFQPASEMPDRLKDRFETTEKLVANFKAEGVDVLDRTLSLAMFNLKHGLSMSHKTGNRRHDAYLERYVLSSEDDRLLKQEEFYYAQMVVAFARAVQPNEKDLSGFVDRFMEVGKATPGELQCSQLAVQGGEQAEFIRKKLQFFNDPDFPPNPCVLLYLNQMMQTPAPKEMFTLFLNIYRRFRKDFSDGYLDIFNYAVASNREALLVLHETVPAISKEFWKQCEISVTSCNAYFLDFGDTFFPHKCLCILKDLLRTPDPLDKVDVAMVMMLARLPTPVSNFVAMLCFNLIKCCKKGQDRQLLQDCLEQAMSKTVEGDSVCQVFDKFKERLPYVYVASSKLDDSPCPLRREVIRELLHSSPKVQALQQAIRAVLSELYVKAKHRGVETSVLLYHLKRFCVDVALGQSYGQKQMEKMGMTEDEFYDLGREVSEVCGEIAAYLGVLSTEERVMHSAGELTKQVLEDEFDMLPVERERILVYFAEVKKGL